MLPFLRAVCKSKKSWMVRHTGIKIIYQIAQLMGCAVLPHLKHLVECIKDGLKDEQQKVNEKLDRIEKKIDITYDQVARSAEDITGIKNDLCFVEEATAKNWNDIAKLKAVK